jgi:hypothetical protein
MVETRERRQRRPKRPFAYLAVLIACAGIALGSAWRATRPSGAVKWIGGGQHVDGKARDAETTAP